MHCTSHVALPIQQVLVLFPLTTVCHGGTGASTRWDALGGHLTGSWTGMCAFVRRTARRAMLTYTPAAAKARTPASAPALSSPSTAHPMRALLASAPLTVARATWTSSTEGVSPHVPVNHAIAVPWASGRIEPRWLTLRFAWQMLARRLQCYGPGARA